MKKTIEERKEYAKIIAQAWVDEEFKKRLIEDPATVLNENGIEIPEGMTVRFVEGKENEILVPMPEKPDSFTGSLGELAEWQLESISGGLWVMPGDTWDPDPDPKIMRLLGFADEELANKTVWKGAGCKRCNGSGYRGRLGIFEMVEMNTEMRDLAFNRSPASKLRTAAKAAGMRPLLEDGKIKILTGITTPEELLRITQAEGLVLT